LAASRDNIFWLMSSSAMKQSQRVRIVSGTN
jgi:hypothetical protein